MDMKLKEAIRIIVKAIEYNFDITIQIFGVKYELIDDERGIYKIYVRIGGYEISYEAIRDFFKDIEEPLNLDMDAVTFFPVKDSIWVCVRVWGIQK